jgi:hypothetical protein
MLMVQLCVSPPCITKSETVEMFNTYSYLAQAYSRQRREGKLVYIYII